MLIGGIIGGGLLLLLIIFMFAGGENKSIPAEDMGDGTEYYDDTVDSENSDAITEGDKTEDETPVENNNASGTTTPVKETKSPKEETETSTGTTINENQNVVNGLNVKKVEYTDGTTTPAGYFQNTGGKNWVESSLVNNTQYQFKQQQRDDWSVYLLDTSRDITIQLDLYNKEVYINWDTADRGLLYYITSSKK